MLVSIRYNSRVKVYLQAAFLTLFIQCAVMGACPDESENLLPDVDPGEGSYSISVDAASTIRPINPSMYGFHVFWRNYAMGMVAEKQPATGPLVYHSQHQTSSGTIPCIKARFDEMRPKLLVFPANFGSMLYNFRDGIGPRQDNTPSSTDSQERPARIYNVSPGEDEGPFPEHMGTDEFIQLCSSYGSLPMLTVNLAGKRQIPSTMSEDDWRQAAQLAANWVEYCNVRITSKIKQQAQTEGWQPTTWSGTDPNKVEVKVPGRSWFSTEDAPYGYFAWLRGHFGHTNPYNVRYWKIGDEPYWLNYSWITADSYRDRFVQIADAIRAVDPQAKLIIQVMDTKDMVSTADRQAGTGKPWTPTVLGTDGSSGTLAYSKADLLDTHCYYGPMSVYGELFYWCNGRFKRNANVVEGGECTIRVKMRNDGGTTDVLLSIDGVPQYITSGTGTWQVAPGPYADYNYQIYLQPGVHEVKLIETGFANNRLYVASVKLVQGSTETILLNQDRERDVIFGSQERMLDNVQDLLDTYPEKQVLNGQMNVCYGGEFNDVSENQREESLSVNRMKGALGMLHMTNRLMKMHSASSTNGVFGKCHWHFSERAAADVDGNGTTDYGWETTGWRVAYHDVVNGSDRIGVTASFHLLKAYSNYALGNLVKCDTVSKQFAVPLSRDLWWDDSRYLDYVDAIAVKTGRIVRVLVTNRDVVPYDFRLNLTGFNRRSAYVKTYRYIGEGMESEKVNIDSQNLTLSNSFKYTFPPCSLVILEFQ